jgi:hypothetical protein
VSNRHGEFDPNAQPASEGRNPGGMRVQVRVEVV